MNAYFLQDPKTGLLWLHEYSIDKDFIVQTHSGELDLSTCNECIAEVVSAVNLGLCRASYDIIVAKDKCNNFAVLVPYYDSYGMGGVYCSISPGFTFSSVYALGYYGIDYVVCENEHGEWERYMIAFNDCPWLDKEDRMFCIPNKLVFGGNCENLADALDSLPISFKCGEVMEMMKFHKGILDLTNVPDDENFRDGNVVGTSVREIMDKKSFLPK